VIGYVHSHSGGLTGEEDPPECEWFIYGIPKNGQITPHSVNGLYMEFKFDQ